MDDLEKCTDCGSTLAANGQCPACRRPEEEPEWLDDYGNRKDEPRAITNGERTSRGSERPKVVAPCSGLTFSQPKAVSVTPEELYAAGIDHQPITPARAAELIEIITAVSAMRGESQPPRLVWLERIIEAGTNQDKGDSNSTRGLGTVLRREVTAERPPEREIDERLSGIDDAAVDGDATMASAAKPAATLANQAASERPPSG